MYIDVTNGKKLNCSDEWWLGSQLVLSLTIAFSVYM